jgi:hypothetical protein
MNLVRCPITFLGIIALSVLSCDTESKNTLSGRSETGGTSDGATTSDPPTVKETVPETLDAAVSLIMGELTDDNREFIIAGREDYEWMLPSHGGMGMRNGWGLWGDSPLSRYFHRLGIYHADDMSGIISTVVSRKVRGVPVNLEGVIAHYRTDWAEQDIVAPLDLNCPHCEKEMRIEYQPEGLSTENPKRVYFAGHCPDGSIFYFYHKDGWASEDKFKKLEFKSEVQRSYILEKTSSGV